MQLTGVPMRIGGTLPFGPTVPFIDQANVTGRHTIVTLYDTMTYTRGSHVHVWRQLPQCGWNDTGVSLSSSHLWYRDAKRRSIERRLRRSRRPRCLASTALRPVIRCLFTTLWSAGSSSNFTKVVNPDTFNYTVALTTPLPSHS